MSKIQSISIPPSKRLETREQPTEGRPPIRRAKLLQLPRIILPQEIIQSYAELPRLFTRRDLDCHLGSKICRDMKWRYLKRMESMGLISHISRKKYEKNFETYSDWLLEVLVPMVKSEENSEGSR